MVGMRGDFASKRVWPLAHPIVKRDEVWICYYGTNQSHGGGVDAAAKFVANCGWMDSFRRILTPLRVVRSPPPYFGFRVRRWSPGHSLRESDDLNANSVRVGASWRSGMTDVSPLAGRVIRLRFRMRSAKFYAFQFRIVRSGRRRAGAKVL